MRVSKGTRATLCTHTVLAVAVLLTVFPFAWMIMASFMPAGEASDYPMRWLPSAPTLEHYQTLFSRLDLCRYAVNSAFIALAVTLASLCLNSMAGYAFAKLAFAGRELVFRGLVLTLLVPGQVTMLPLFMVLKSLGLINSYWGVILPGMASVFGIFLVRQYALSIPDSLLDAARIDGAGEWRIYRSIVLPLCKPVLLTLAVFTFLGTWNDFLWPLVVLTDSRLHTLPVALANLSGEHVQDTELMMAGSVLTVLPVIVLYALLQRYYIQGILLGSVKG